MRPRRNISLISHFESVKRPARSCTVVEPVSEDSVRAPAPHGENRAAETSSARGAPPVAQEIPRWALGLLLLVCAMNVLTSSGRWLLAAVSPLMRFELEISETQAAWLATVVLLTVAISSPLIGYLVDRFTRPRLLAPGICSLEPGALCRPAADERTISCNWRSSWSGWARRFRP